MHRIRRHPIFFALVAIIVVATGAEAWFVVMLRRQEHVLEVQLNQKISEIERLQRQRPGPTDENLRRAREDFAQHAEVLTTMLRSLLVAGPDELDYFTLDEPKDRTDAFFKIAQFGDTMRKNCADAGVVIRPDERFGFAAYANEGPEPDLILPVYRQHRIVEYLLSVLLPARPRTLIGVQREDPRAIVQSAGKSAGAPTAKPVAPAPARPASAFAGSGAPAAGAASELFTIDPQVSARTPGYVDTMAFRITFTGQTSSLRGFMNALAAPDIPLVVRSVEAEPLRGEGTSATNRPGGRLAEGESIPSDFAIVADNESRFTVTVEFFEVKLRAPEVPATTP